jgi:hypothetical protein
MGQLANAIAKVDPDAESAADAIHRYLGIAQKGAQGAGGAAQGGGPDEAAKALGAARLAQVLEGLPAPARRAVAMAALGFPEPDAKRIAEALVQKGGAPAARQELAPRLGAAPPVVRQLAVVALGLPFDAGAGEIVRAASGADKGALAAAKGAASLGDGDGVGEDKKAGLPGPARPAPGAEDRLGYLLSFEALNSATPQQDRDGISSWFRSIVDLLISARSARQDAATERAASPSPAGAAARQAPPSAPQSAPHGAAQTGEQAQTWRSWRGGCVRALADPAVAREATFHALAAKEGVNYFELPLPWAPGRPLEMWVESDGDGNGRGKGAPGHRVLLGMTFSALGETRVGLESAGKRLGVRIWAEQTKPIEAVLPRLMDELSALGFEPAVSLSALAAPPGTIKSALGGPGLNAVG